MAKLSTLEKLEWFPVYVAKFKGSNKFKKMTDFQRGWYFSLILEAADSDKPGFLLDDGELWELAGARSRTFFDENKGLVMACFKSTTVDGRSWIFNPKLLKVLEEQSQKHENKRSRKKLPSYSYSLSDPLSGFVLSIYEDYPRKEGRGAALDAILRAIHRRMKLCECSVEDAAQHIHERTILYAKARIGKDPQFTPHPSTWFNQDRYLDDAKMWALDTKTEPYAVKTTGANYKTLRVEDRFNDDD